MCLLIYLCFVCVSILLTRLPPQGAPSQTSRLALPSSHTHSGHVYPQYEPVRQQSPRHLVLSQKTASCWFRVWGRVLCWGVQLLHQTNQPTTKVCVNYYVNDDGANKVVHTNTQSLTSQQSTRSLLVVGPGCTSVSAVMVQMGDLENIQTLHIMYV